jgi:hypothetical protein
MAGQRLETTVALVLALASTVLVSLAYLREQAAVQTLPPLSFAHPAASLRGLLSNRSWRLGFLMEGAGFAMYVAALALAPLALVQSVAAGGVGVLAIGSARMARRRLSRAERVGAGLSVAGLLCLGVSLIGGSVRSVPGSPLAIAAWLGGTGVLAACMYLFGRRVISAAVAYAIAGGLLFSCGDISVKAATGGGVRFAFACSAIAGYVLGTSVVQIAYQHGGALTVAGIAQLLTSALPIAAGPVLFEEPVPAGALGVLRVLAFVMVVAGAVVLARPTVSDPRRPGAPDRSSHVETGVPARGEGAG